MTNENVCETDKFPCGEILVVFVEDNLKLLKLYTLLSLWINKIPADISASDKEKSSDEKHDPYFICYRSFWVINILFYS